MSLLSNQERSEDVIELFEELRKNDFDWTTLYPFAAEAYSKLEDYERAYEFYRLAYTDNKEDVAFLEKFVYFLLEEGKRNEAREILEQLLMLQPAEAQWMEMLDSLD